MILFVLILAAAVLILFREAYARLWSRGVEASVAVEEPYVYQGERAHFTEIAANRGRIPLVEIEVRFRMPQGPVFEEAENVVISDHLYKRDIFSLRPMEQVTRKYLLQCPRRGSYPVSDLTVKAHSFWHTKEYELRQKTDAVLTVYAAWTDVSGIMAHCDTILGSLESRRRTYEDPFAWASIRAYTPQDPMRSVNWKASARTGELMVNTYASVQAAQFCILLDTVDDRIVKQDDLVELGISAAASLARLLVRRGQEAGLYVYTNMTEADLNAGINEGQSKESVHIPPAAGRGITLPPARGQAQLTQIEQVLAGDLTGFLGRKAGHGGNQMQRADLPPFASWVQDIVMTDAAGCICVCISKEEERLSEAERKLAAKDARIPLILVQPVSENGTYRLRTRTARERADR